MKRRISTERFTEIYNQMQIYVIGVIRANNKPHIQSDLRKTILTRSRLRNNADRSDDLMRGGVILIEKGKVMS